MRLAFITFLCLIFCAVNAQRGKDGAKTVGGTEVVNEYTTLSADAMTGATAVTVNSNNLNANGRFTGALAAGDLILIIQIQGATINGQLHPTFGDVCDPNNSTWGSIASLNNCGNWEYVEVTGTTGTTIINLRCGLSKSYTSSGRVQVVRVPRYSDLTVTGTLTADDWNGTSGGILAVEVNGSTTINGMLDVTSLGFRGGSVAGNNGSLDFNFNWFAGTTQDKGGEKGESVVGDWADYQLVGGRYAKGAIGNGGGGGSAHNAGGAGGANASNGVNTWSGVGVPDFITGSYATAWALEGLTPGSESSGGGRGGYAWSNNSNNPLTTGPGNSAWAGDNRNNLGGYGGRDLDYSTGKLFFGGGGGGGHENDNQGGNGGDGGGMIFISSNGAISGTGSIIANGENGQSSDYTSAGFGQVTNKDGSGGAGAGGTVFVSSPSSISGISISVNGGNGGNQVLNFGAFASSNEAQGPGGGGGGGYIRTNGITGSTSVNGGNSGTTNASTMSSFPPNGASGGDVGLVESTLFTGSSLASVNDTICVGSTANLSATGSPETGSTIVWYDAGWNQVGTGSSMTTGVLSSNSMFFYGSCPGTDFDTVYVIVSPAVVIDDSGVIIADESCAGGDGSITGILVSGGIGSYTFDWNGGPSSAMDTTGATAGTYSLVVTDAAGCTDASGPYSIGTGSGLSIDVTGVIIADETCAGNDGSITGILVTGGTSPYTYSWNGGSASGADTLSASAGSYTLVVTDQLGCVDSIAPISIGSLTGLTVDISGMIINDANCAASDGSITGILVTGGTLPYSYTWNGSLASSEDTVGLAAGSYTLQVTDDNGCVISSGPHLVNSVNTLAIDSVGFLLSDENCTAADGSITGITVSGGGTPYSYFWNGVPASGADTTGLGAGSYMLVVADNNGCIDSTGVYTINSVNTLAIDSVGFLLSDENCTATDGSITGITVSGGGTPYSYFWNGVPASGADTTGLGSGSYTLVVSDINGCIDSTGIYTISSVNSMVIDTTGAVIADANCGAADGGVSGILVSGMGSSYTYSWNGAISASIDLTGAPSGIYTLVVTDDNGCIDSTGVYNVGSVSTLSIDTAGMSIVNENCTAGDGSITGIVVTGGTTPYTFQWNGSGATGADTVGLSSGTYTLTVTDNAGCTEVIGPISVGTSTTLTSSDSGVIISDEHCGMADGAINGIVASGAGTLSYEWNGTSSSGIDTIGLANGMYTLVITDGNGCVDSLGPYTINNISGPVIDTSSILVTNDACNQGIGSIVNISTSGGTGPVNMDWNGTASGIDLTGLFAGNYTLVVTDSVGCMDSVGPVVILDIGSPTAAFTATPMVTDVNNPLVVFTDASSSDVTSWYWTFDSLGIDSVQHPSFNFYDPGSYIVTLAVSNSLGCADSLSLTIIVNEVDSIVVPNIVTPDGNGQNDVFRISGLPTGSLVSIYNRWGQKLFEAQNYLNNWDGRTSTGERVKDGTYYYIIVDPQGVKYTGHVSIIGG